MLGLLVESGETLGAMLAIAGVLAIHPRSRKVGYVLFRFARRHAPRWAVVLMVAPIPGPVDEIAALAGIVWAFRSHRNRVIFARYMRVAFNR